MSRTAKFSNIPSPAHPEKAKEGVELFKNDVAVPQGLVEAIFGNSPYLSKLASLDKTFFLSLCESGFDRSFNKLVDELINLDITKTNKKDLMSLLRVNKNRVSLLIALADITNSWDLKKITNSLSDFADLAVKLATGFLFNEKFQQKFVTSPKPEDSGFIVLAVGKLGGRELNYSSDIDLIILYDPDRTNYSGKLSPKEFFIRLTQELVEILQHRTADGYIFRTDLRLRPDPYSTPVAVSTKAAELYYENVGQNWERAAMIKARFIAGDEIAARKYLQFLGTYIWRKYLDFKAIEDIHSIKRQIDSSNNYKPEEFLGYNIKLGKGGIREIEFFVQTQQLIWGGREELLRCNTTCDGLRILEEIGHIRPGTCAELTKAYEFYRKIEHRLQMVADEHTHSLPDNETAFKNFAVFLGYDDAAKFKSELSASLALVQKHYARLFGESMSLSLGKDGNLVFTGVSNDPETLLTVGRMGFREAEKICEIIRGWHHGRRRATRFRRVREILTELVPHILKSFSGSSNPDEAFIKFDDFLGQIPSGVQLFMVFEEKPELIDLIAEIMGNSPWLAQNLSRSPALVARILLTDYGSEFPERDQLKQSLEKAVSYGTDFEEKMKIIRRWKHDHEFQVGIRLLKNSITHGQSAIMLSDIAESVIGEVFTLAREEEGDKKGQAAILAMGKLGVRELTFGSDIDLVFVYDSQDAEAANYFSRVASKFTNLMTVLSPDGMLYNVDTRLRPMGEKGPLAASLETYEKYYLESAWNWEFMALTKTRVIFGDKKLCDKLKTTIAKSLTREFDKKQLAADMHKMRLKIAESFGSKDIWDVKYAEGGLFEIEFIFQYYILAESHKFPDIITANFESMNIAEFLRRKNIIGAKTAEDLGKAFDLLRNVQSAIRLTTLTDFVEKTAGDNQKKVMTNSLHEAKFDGLKAKLVATEKLVHDYYMQIFN